MQEKQFAQGPVLATTRDVAGASLAEFRGRHWSTSLLSALALGTEPGTEWQMLPARWSTLRCTTSPARASASPSVN